MSKPQLAMACRWCDAVISAPCEADEIPTVSARFEQDGWTWIEGFATCPKCSVERSTKQEAA